MAFQSKWLRRIGFDERLRGTGAQVHNDLMVSSQIRAAGGGLLYDPEVVVDHYMSFRPSGDDRASIAVEALSDEVHNETLAILEFLPAGRRVLFVVWSMLCGTRRTPGLVVTLILLGKPDNTGIQKLVACTRGRAAGLATWWGGRG